MSVSMSLLSILDLGPSYGLRLKQEFETRTGGVWPLNVGQVYTTLDRLEREGLARESEPGHSERQRVHEITPAGRQALRAWFATPLADAPGRDPLVLKIVMASRHPGVDSSAVIQPERRAAVELLQRYTRLKRDPADDADLGWGVLVDSLIFKAEARVRWLDACEARLQRDGLQAAAPPGAGGADAGETDADDANDNEGVPA